MSNLETTNNPLIHDLNAEPETSNELVGNLLVGQSGGPTAVINASVAGVIRRPANTRTRSRSFTVGSTASSASYTRT